MATCSLKRIPLDSQDSTRFLLTSRSGSEYRLILVDGTKCYEGRASEDILNAMAAKVQMDPLDFVGSLTYRNSENFALEYIVEERGSGCRFSWLKRVIGEDALKVKLGTVELLAVDRDGALSDILAEVSRQMEADYQEVQSLTKACEDLDRERKEALMLLETAVVAKEDLERELYSKFVVALNAKKEKLREAREGSRSPSPPSHQNRPQMASRTTDEKTNGARSDLCVDTGVQEEDQAPLLRRRVRAEVSRKRAPQNNTEEGPGPSKRPTTRRRVPVIRYSSDVNTQDLLDNI